jgi:hypothetical protein
MLPVSKMSFAMFYYLNKITKFRFTLVYLPITLFNMAGINGMAPEFKINVWR